MNFNFAEICTNIFNYLTKYFVQVDTDMPWLKYVVFIALIFMILTRIKINIEAKKQVERNMNYLKEHKKNSAEIKKQNFIDNERKIINSNVTYVAFYFKFLKFKTENEKTENPNFTKLILSFLSDVNLYKATFIKTENPKEKQYYFLKFDLQEEALLFIQNFEKSVEDFAPILHDFGYEISYKIVVDNRNRDIDINEITNCLKNIINITQDFGIYATMLFKEFYDRNGDDKIYLSFTPQGKYMIGAESMELYYLEK